MFPTRAGSAAARADGAPGWASAASAGVRVVELGRPRAAAAAVPLPTPVGPDLASNAAVVEEPRLVADPAPSTLAPAPVDEAPPVRNVPSIAPPTRDAGVERELREAALALVRARPDVLASVESELLALAVDIATVLVEDELSRRPELHRALVRAALDGLEPGGGVRVRATRATYDALLEAFDQASVDAGRGRVSVELDASLEGAGAIVDVQGASIDGRAAPRLEALRGALEHALRSRQAA